VNDRIATWDVGIMPLRDGPYERAKCGYKLLQYAASGVPAVGSPVGVNARCSPMDGADPVSVPDDWADALVAVLDAPAERRAASGRDGVSWSPTGTRTTHGRTRGARSGGVVTVKSCGSST
jgi:glycosyltransferase involved in cell wall biosynthesis